MKKLGPDNETENAELMDCVGVLRWLHEEMNKPGFAPSAEQFQRIAKAGTVMLAYDPSYIAALVKGGGE